MQKSPSGLPAESIEHLIVTIRGQRVILDADLARIYGVPTKALNQGVRRNPGRFPHDFAFRLTAEESESIRSQFVTASKRNLRFRPYAFTEHGAIMAANVLTSPRAVVMSVYVVRAFVRMRSALAASPKLGRRLAALEKALEARLDLHESAIVDVLKRIMDLIDPPPESVPARPKIGFNRGTD